MAKKVSHLHTWTPEGQTRRLCDGQPQKLPLPHFTDDFDACDACVAKRDQLPAGVETGVGLSFTMEKH